MTARCILALAATTVTLFTAPADARRGRLRTVTSAGLLVRTDLPLPVARRVHAQLQSQLSDLRRTLKSLLKRPLRQPLTCLLFATRAAYLRHAARVLPAQHGNAGFTIGHRVVTFWYGNSLSLLRHELVHALLAPHQRNWPIWVKEGIAEWLSPLGAPGAPNRQRLSILLSSLAYGDLAARTDVTGGDLSGPKRHLLYAQAWSMVHYVLNRPALRPQFLRLLRSGAPAAWTTWIGKNLSAKALLDLQQVLRRLAHRRLQGDLFSASVRSHWRGTLGCLDPGPSQAVNWPGHCPPGQRISLSLVPRRTATLVLRVLIIQGTLSLGIGSTFYRQAPVTSRFLITARTITHQSLATPPVLHETPPIFTPGKAETITIRFENHRIRVFHAGRIVLTARRLSNYLGRIELTALVPGAELRGLSIR